MLKGTEFGKAIGEAIQRKLDRGSASSKAAIARHFNMQPPSLTDWVKKGSVAKDKLPELWRYFSDVAGPEHWGLTSSEWPSGLMPGEQEATHHGAEQDALTTTCMDEARLLLMYRNVSPDHQKYIVESVGVLFSLFSDLPESAKNAIQNTGREDFKVARFSIAPRGQKKKEKNR